MKGPGEKDPEIGEQAERLEGEISEIREHLFGREGLVGELDRRRHLLAPAALLHRYRVPLVLTAVGLIAVTGIALTWRSSRATRGNALGARARRLGVALGVVDEHRGWLPRRRLDRGTPPRFARRLLTSVGAAAMAIAVRRLTARLLSARPT